MKHLKINFFVSILLLLSLISVFFVLSIQAAVPNIYTPMTVEELSFDRTAVNLTPARAKNLPNFLKGFIWDKEDNHTLNWRPQGITEFSSNKKFFIAATWYGRMEKGYSNRGARVSFVDYSDKNSIKYTHVLLVDEELTPLAKLHAGGLLYLNGKFYVPDTREKNNWSIHTYPITSLYLVPDSERKRLFDFKYILVRDSTNKIDIAPSFLSYDWSRDLLLVGSYNKNNSGPLHWFDSDRETKTLKGLFYKKMQGAVSSDDYLWISTSYGMFFKSYLYHGPHKLGEPVDLSRFTEIPYPPGLEDMHVSATSNQLWMLTEFGPDEGFFNNRVVFSIEK